MTTFLRAYLAAVRASVAGGKEVVVARLVTLSSRTAPEKLSLPGDRVLIQDVGDGLEALLNGRAIDLAAPTATFEVDAAARVAGVTAELALEQLAAWQDSVRDWLLRGTIAPVGDLGWLSVHDETVSELDEVLGIRRTISQRQRVRFHASPQLRAAYLGEPPPPPIDLARLTEVLRRHLSEAVDVTGDLQGLSATLERLGFRAAATRPMSPDVPPAIAELWRRCVARPLAHVRVLADPDAVRAALDELPVKQAGEATAMPFARDGGVIAFCTRGDVDPGVLAHPARDHHRCPDDHPVRLSQWLAAMLLATELETLAPASFPEDAIAAIAAELAPFGRIAGELSRLVVAGPAWWTPPPPPPPPPPASPTVVPPVPRHPPRAGDDLAAAAYADEWLTITPGRQALRVTSARSGDILLRESNRAGLRYEFLDIPVPRLYEVHPAPLDATPHSPAWLRLWGCFHGLEDHGRQDGTCLELGPLPRAVAGTVAAKLRRAIGLPRALVPLPSTQGLIGRTVRQWVEVMGTWGRGQAEMPDFDGLLLRLPRLWLLPPRGTRLRVRGVFEGPRAPGEGPGTLFAMQWDVLG